ncbi:efflux RND transporter permease subunit [Escherichia coli]
MGTKTNPGTNELLSLAAQSPDQLLGYANGLANRYADVASENVNAAKAEAMGVASFINQTISTAFGSSYVNDFLNQGRVKVYVQAGTPFRMLPDNITTAGPTPLARWHRFLPTLSSQCNWTGSPRLELQRHPVTERF